MDKQVLDRFLRVAQEFDHAMLVTQHDKAELRARPMAIADCTDAASLWFLTDVDSAKIEELTDYPQVNLALQDGKRFLSISGTARATRDRDRIRELWSEAHRVWFEKGMDDPSLILLEIVPSYAEYWDRSGAAGAEYLLAEARALVTGDTLSNDAGTHEKLRFPDDSRDMP